MILHLAHLQHYCKCHFQKVHLTIEQPTEMVMFSTLNTIPQTYKIHNPFPLVQGFFYLLNASCLLLIPDLKIKQVRLCDKLLSKLQKKLFSSHRLMLERILLHTFDGN